MLLECSQRQDGERRIDLANCIAQEARRLPIASFGQRMKTDEVRDVALKSTVKRNVDLPPCFCEERAADGRDDADDLYRLAGFRVAGQVCTHSDIAAAACRDWSVVLRVLDQLAERIAVRPELAGQSLIDDGDGRAFRTQRL